MNELLGQSFKQLEVLNKYNFMNENAKTELQKISEYISAMFSRRIWNDLFFNFIVALKRNDQKEEKFNAESEWNCHK